MLRNAHCRRVQSLSRGYATSTSQCHMRPIRYIADIVLSYPPPSKKKKFVSSLTEDINPLTSHWNNGKMKIACNSAYIQTETLNFIFAWQTLIVYFYICSNHRRGYCHNVISLPRVTASLLQQSAATKPRHQQHCYIFAYFSYNPYISLELDCVFRKPMNHRFQRYII